MPQAASEGFSVVFDSYRTGYSALASGTNNLVSTPSSLSRLSSFSFQIFTDGGAIVDYNVQVTNAPGTYVDRYGAIPMLNAYRSRDDTFASNQWSTVATGVIPAAAGVVQGAFVNCNITPRNARITFVWDTGNAGGAIANIWACVHGIGL